VQADELAFTPITLQAEMVRSGEIAPRELVEVYLERIERLDPMLNAFRVVMAERALVEAQQAEARRKQGEQRPLLGVPIAIKDDTDVAGEVTGNGVDQLNAPAEGDAEVVRRLRAAGAVVIGKTQVPELTAQPFTETIAFGTTRNPWSLERSPGGSSGGSAAAVAAGLVGAALGSDGAGSIRIPSACCALFGVKPSRGRVSNAPAAEGWRGLGVRGPIARTVADAALFLDACHGAIDTDAGAGARTASMSIAPWQASRNSDASATVRAIGPRTPSPRQPSAAGAFDTRPRDGLTPNSPQHADEIGRASCRERV